MRVVRDDERRLMQADVTTRLNGERGGPRGADTAEPGMRMLAAKVMLMLASAVPTFAKLVVRFHEPVVLSGSFSNPEHAASP